MLSPELHLDQVPSIFQRFQEVVGDAVWLDQASSIAQEISDTPYMAEYLLEQNRVVLALAECSVAAAKNGNRLPWHMTSMPKVLEALVFIWQTVQLIDAACQISNKRARILISRVKEALRKPRMLQAMQLETQVATHFLVAGRRVVFPELGNSRETFDLLIEDLGPGGLEIECKFVTYDKGRKIHRAEARHCLSRLQVTAPVQLAATNSSRGLAVRVTVPERLPEPRVLDAFCAAVGRVILSGSSGALDDGTSVRLFDFDPAILGTLTNPPQPAMLEAISDVAGSSNRHCLVLAPRGSHGGVVVLVIDSARPDSMLHELFETYADSAGRQLTGRRAGALASMFEDLRREQLADIASNEGKDGIHSALAWAASAFLERAEFPHLVGVGFLSAPNYSSTESAAQGMAYWIPKRTSTMWSPEFAGMFGPDPRRAVLRS